MGGKGENPFDDVGDGENAAAANTATTEPSSDPNETTSSGTESEETMEAVQSTATDAETAAEPRQQPLPVEKSEPGFPFSDCDQVQLYLRTATDNRLDDLKHDVSGHLRRAYGVRNVENRELDDAIVTALVEQLSPEQIAAIVIENRGYSP